MFGLTALKQPIGNGTHVDRIGNGTYVDRIQYDMGLPIGTELSSNLGLLAMYPTCYE